MRPIICLSSEPWSRLPGRTQQYMSRLRDGRILYFSPSRRWQDFSPGQKGLAVRPNVTAYFAVAAACVYFLTVELPKGQQPEETF